VLREGDIVPVERHRNGLDERSAASDVADRHGECQRHPLHHDGDLAAPWGLELKAWDRHLVFVVGASLDRHVE
jgi:hypothetical protein